MKKTSRLILYTIYSYNIKRYNTRKYKNSYKNMLTHDYSSAIINSTTEQRQSDAVRRVSMNMN